jgi:ABC-2 type transport system ATP-binding protein
MDIRVQRLSKVYRGNVHALNDLTLTIPGGVFGLLGPNGAGKTTLMRIMAGILNPTSGELSIGGNEGTTERGRLAIKRILGYIPQDLGMYPDLSAREFLDYVGILKGLTDRKLRKQRVESLLHMVSLSDAAQRKIKTFSGGMKRRVGIAQALLNDPQILIVDEPTAGLDPEERIRFRNLLSELGGNRTILLSTHIVEDISQTCQNIAVMKHGQVIFQGIIAQLLEQVRGKVWLITTQAAQPKPQGNFTVVSMLNTGLSIQYRVVGALSMQPGIVPAEPTLEDGYIWLMQEQPAPAGAMHSFP